MTITKVAGPLAMLLCVTLVRRILELLWHRQIIRRTTKEKQNTVDKLERLETLVFSLPLIGSWQGCFELVRAIDSGSDEDTRGLARAGGAVGITLFSFQVIYIFKYSLYTWLVVKMEKGERNDARAKRDSKGVTGLIISRYSQTVGLERMQLRTSYTAKRFAPHAPYWQFVVWGRQLLLTIVTLIPAFLAHRGSVDEIEYIRGEADMLLVVQTSTAIGIIVVFTIFHWRVKPFAFHFQNWMESKPCLCRHRVRTIARYWHSLP